ncbi:MAG TPA: hypothetical protein VKQ28_17885 [Candidatus Acidoferrum sp.]|nr:hypothetical protein [Candidatus Acidoferrum sp.]
MLAVRAHLPGYGKLHVFRNAAIRTGVYSGVGLSMVLVAWVVVANRAPSLEVFALERNIAAAVALGLFAAVPVLRFLRLPGPLLASSLIAWCMVSLTYRFLCVYFWGLAARYSAVQLFTLGVILYMILATLSWIGTCISRARGTQAPH